MPEETEQSLSPAPSDAQSAGITAGVAAENSSVGGGPEPDGDATQAAPTDEALADDTGGELTDEEIEELKANESAYTWQASEYVHHHKGGMWYLGLFVVLAILIAILYLMHSWLEIGLCVMMGIAIVIYARRAPRSLTYELSPTGVTIDGKFHDFTVFRAFSVLEDTDWHVIDLEPAKRFSPRLSILFDSANTDEIVGHLSLHLVRSDRQPDPIERVARYLRF